MNLWWNLPFALFVGLAVTVRLVPARPIVRSIAPALRFFGIDTSLNRRATADVFGISGVAGLLFVGWTEKLAVPPDGWILVDVLVTSVGLGLAGAWVLARYACDDDLPRHRDRL